MHPVPGRYPCQYLHQQREKMARRGKATGARGDLLFWFLGVEISFLPTMKNHHVDGNKDTRSWERTVNKIIISIFVWTILNLIEKFIIQLIAMSYHSRTYSDRIEINKF